MADDSPSLPAAVLKDLVLLHEVWLELIFPRQRSDRHPVLGRWKPESPVKLAGYYLWAALGIPVVLVMYPFVLFGVIVRFQTRKMSAAARDLGLIGVLLVFAVVWSLLALIVWVVLDTEAFLAVLSSAVVATISAGIAFVAHQRGGRASTVLIAYPAGVTAVFLPPIVAALFSETVGDVVLPHSEDLAVFILDEVLFVFDLNERIRDLFELEGVGFVGMWLAIAIPVGWFLGVIVTLADVIRPRD